MLFLGSSGVGKTELAKQVALYMNQKNGTGETGKDLTDLEEKSKFVRLDMRRIPRAALCGKLDL